MPPMEHRRKRNIFKSSRKEKNFSTNVLLQYEMLDPAVPLPTSFYFECLPHQP